MNAQQSFVSRYQSPEWIVEFATRMCNELSAVIAAHMRSLGVPESMIGLRGIASIEPGQPFVRFPNTQIGGNLNAAVNPLWIPGIALDHGILDGAHPSMRGVPAWGDPTTRLRDRIDAAIAHEYTEATLVPPMELTEVARVAWLHREAIRRAPDTSLPITERARAILRQYRAALGL